MTTVHSSADCPSLLMPLVYVLLGIAARVWVFARLRLCCLLVQLYYVLRNDSAVAGLVHAFGSWQRCVW